MRLHLRLAHSEFVQCRISAQRHFIAGTFDNVDFSSRFSHIAANASKRAYKTANSPRSLSSLQPDTSQQTDPENIFTSRFSHTPELARSCSRCSSQLLVLAAHSRRVAALLTLAGSQLLVLTASPSVGSFCSSQLLVLAARSRCSDDHCRLSCTRICTVH